MIYTYTGKGFSLNEAYNKHWTKSKIIKDRLKLEFNSLFSHDPISKRIERFSLSIKFNGRYDVDNISPMAKIFVDTMRSRDYIKDDTKNIYHKLTMEFDSQLPKNTYVFSIIPD